MQTLNEAAPPVLVQTPRDKSLFLLELLAALSELTGNQLRVCLACDETPAPGYGEGASGLPAKAFAEPTLHA